MACDVLRVAITLRAIHLQGGSLCAVAAKRAGLQVQMDLPAEAWRRSGRRSINVLP
ncbi:MULTISPECIES: ATP-binding protein [Pseudomonas]|uniref:hypothetical protein n=1 Tax=Pseudomonas TaxID=286 RepID=UPI001485FFAB|nr:hypothetical protein [Pseudomonas mosselii]